MAISLLNAYLSKSVPQNLLLTERDFERYAKDRGLYVRREDLEFFEELGLLFPLCRLKLPVVEEYEIKGEIRKRYAALFNISHNLLEWCKKGHCEDPTKTEFRPWKEYKDGFQVTARALYHPWQFMNLKKIFHWLGHKISVPQILEEKRLERIRENVKKFWGSQKDWIGFIAKRVYRDLRFLPFLISIEDVYLPLVRSSFKGVPWKPDHGFEIWKSLRSDFDPKEALSEFGLTIKQIEDWRTQIAVEARSLDPLRDWYLLVRHATYHKRQKLNGDALFAQDCYQIVELLGRFLEELTGEQQYGPDDLLNAGYGEWKKRIYEAEVDFINRDVLRKIAYEYGLDYDYRMILFVEGPTEYNAIPVIAEAMGISFAGLGIRLENLGGYSEISLRRIEKLLQYAKKNGTMVYIIIDNHPRSRKFVEDLIVRKDLPVEEERVRIWDIDFEEDNFAIDELIQATTSLAAKKGVSIILTKEMVEEKRKLAKKTGIGDILIDIYEEQACVLSKADLGSELGLMVAERIEGGKVRTTKIEDELLKVAKITSTL